MLTRCEVSSKPCLLIANYAESVTAPDSSALSGFAPLFRLTSVKKHEGDIPRKDAAERMKRSQETEFGNLYL